MRTGRTIGIVAVAALVSLAGMATTVVADRSLTTFFDEWLFATDIPDAYPN